MYHVITKYRDGSKGDYQCHGEELARAWFRCQVNAAELDRVLKRDYCESVMLLRTSAIDVEALTTGFEMIDMKSWGGL